MTSNSKPAQRARLLSDAPARSDTAFAHDRTADAIASLILETGEGGKSIAITGSWGSGKSTVVELVREKLTGQAAVFLFDAWSYQDDPLRRAFLEALLRFVHSSGDPAQCEQWQVEIDRISGRREMVTTSSKRRLTRVAMVVAAMSLFTTGIGAGLMRDHFWWGLGVLLSPLAFAAVAVLIDAILKRNQLITIFKNRDRTRSVLDLVFATLLRDLEETKTTETEKSGEPAAAQFLEVFDAMAEAAIRSQKRLVVVVDNLDRVDPQKAIAMWATMRIFFDMSCREKEADWIRNLWLIAPFDRTALARLWAKEENAKGVVDSFVNKTFQTEFRVAPAVLGKWREFFQLQFQEAFLEDRTREQWAVVFRIFERSQKASPSYRDIKLFLNRLVSLYLQRGDEVPLPYLAFYLTDVPNIEGDPKLLANAEYPEPGVRGLLPQGWDRFHRQSMIGAIHFNVPAKDAVHALIGDRLEQAISEENAEELMELYNVPGFWLVCERLVTNRMPVYEGSPAELVRSYRFLFRNVADDPAGVSVKRNLQQALCRSIRWAGFDESSVGVFWDAWRILADASEEDRAAFDAHFRAEVRSIREIERGLLSRLKSVPEALRISGGIRGFQFPRVTAAVFADALRWLVQGEIDQEAFAMLRCDEMDMVAQHLCASTQFTTEHAVRAAGHLADRLTGSNWQFYAEQAVHSAFAEKTAYIGLVLFRGDDARRDAIWARVGDLGARDRASVASIDTPAESPITPLSILKSLRQGSLSGEVRSQFSSEIFRMTHADLLCELSTHARLGWMLVALSSEGGGELLHMIADRGRAAECLPIKDSLSITLPDPSFREKLHEQQLRSAGCVEEVLACETVSVDGLELVWKAYLRYRSPALLAKLLRWLIDSRTLIPLGGGVVDIVFDFGLHWLPKASLGRLGTSDAFRARLEEREQDDALLGESSTSDILAKVRELPVEAAVALLFALRRRVEGLLLLAPEDVRLHADRGRILQELAERSAEATSFTQAAAAFARACEIEPNHIEGNVGLAMELLRCVEWEPKYTKVRRYAEAALERCEAALVTSPGHKMAEETQRRALARLDVLLAFDDPAMSALREAQLSNSPEALRAPFVKAAAKSASEAVELAPENPWILMQAAQGQMTGQPPKWKARAYLLARRALATNPEYAPALALLREVTPRKVAVPDHSHSTEAPPEAPAQRPVPQTAAPKELAQTSLQRKKPQYK
ncbi:MAG: AAA family ATPase [Bryobacterales bacterium]|nr:AAA family ATPase [Bryobacterales bacterium]